MEKLLSIRGYLIGNLLVAMIAIFACIACDWSSEGKKTTGDSVNVVASSPIEVAPTSFTTVQEVLLFHDSLETQLNIENEFLSMPSEVLKAVSTVCLKRHSNVTQKDIVLEYLANKPIYDSFISSDTIDESVTENVVVDEPPASNVSYHYEIDTIDGKATKVLVKEERYESK